MNLNESDEDMVRMSEKDQCIATNREEEIDDHEHNARFRQLKIDDDGQRAALQYQIRKYRAIAALEGLYSIKIRPETRKNRKEKPKTRLEKKRN